MAAPVFYVGRAEADKFVLVPLGSRHLAVLVGTKVALINQAHYIVRLLKQPPKQVRRGSPDPAVDSTAGLQPYRV